MYFRRSAGERVGGRNHGDWGFIGPPLVATAGQQSARAKKMGHIP